MHHRLARVVQWELLLLFIASPLLLFPNTTFGLGMLVVPGLWGLRRFATGRFVVPTPFDIPILILLAMTGVGQWVSADPAFSLAKSAGVVLGVGTYYALVATAERRTALRGALLLLIGMNAGVAVLSLVVTAWVTKFPWFEPLLARLPRVTLALAGNTPEGFNPNGVAGIFLFGLPLLVVLTVSHHRHLVDMRGRWVIPFRIGIAAIALLILLLFAATQSRAGYVSLAISFVFVFLLPRPRWLGAMAGIAGVALLLFWFSPYREPLVSHIFTPASADGALSTLSGRVALWERAATALTEAPLTGVGLGMFRFVQPRLYPLFTVPLQSDIGHAHNQFLQAGMDVGVLGLIAYLALWGGAATLALVTLWRSPAASLQPVLLGLLAGWLGHFLWATVEVHALGSKGGWFWWWSLGCMTAVMLQMRLVRD